MHKGWIMVAVLGLAGCASVPASYIDQSMAIPSEGRHVVSIERGNLFPGGEPLTVWVDGAAVAELPGGQSINLYLKDGRHIVGVGMYARTGGNAPERTVAIDVSAQSMPILRASTVGMGYGGWEVRQVDK